VKVLDAIPHQLKGRGHNECTPIECDCGEIFLFGLSDGTISDGDLANNTVPVKCPTCKKVEDIAPAALVSHPGQVK
jgi:hypothetical protein